MNTTDFDPNKSIDENRLYRIDQLESRVAFYQKEISQLNSKLVELRAELTFSNEHWLRALPPQAFRESAPRHAAVIGKELNLSDAHTQKLAWYLGHLLGAADNNAVGEQLLSHQLDVVKSSFAYYIGHDYDTGAKTESGPHPFAWSLKKSS